MKYPAFIKRDEADADPSAYVVSEEQHDEQLKGWGRPGLYADDDPDKEAPAELDAVRAELDAKEIAYDKRWGIKRLKALLSA